MWWNHSMTLSIPPKRRPKNPPSAARAARIDAICGRYANVPTSSNKFAAKKKRQIQREARRR
jgi:hypothetical protein